MEKKKQEMLSVVFLASIIVFLFLFLIFGEKEEYSLSERRQLKEFPKITSQSLEKGDFGKEFEEYTLDHFPLREEFRGIKALVSQTIFVNRDQNGLYKKEGYLVKMEYPMNQKMVEYAAGKIENIYNLYLKDSNSSCYLSIVPDKNYFLGKKYGKLTMDYSSLFKQLEERLSFAKYVDITKLLEIEDFYRTDTHWRQEKILDVAEYLAKEMGTKLSTSYEKIKMSDTFRGVYAGQWSLPVLPEELYYLTNDVLKESKVFSVGERELDTDGIYDFSKVEDKDPYEMFLHGAKAILVIENPKGEEGRELLVFRDSFASSLIPLLVPGYSRITLIDIRYVQSNMLDRLIDFKGQDVLFLYSTLVLNQSLSFK